MGETLNSVDLEQFLLLLVELTNFLALAVSQGAFPFVVPFQALLH